METPAPIPVDTVTEKLETPEVPQKSKCASPALSVNSSKSDGSDKSEASSRSASPKNTFEFAASDHTRKLISKPIVEGKTCTTILYEVVAVLPTPTKISYFQVETDTPRTRKSRFRIELHINDELYAVGTGTSKKAAKQDASQMALEKLVKEDSRIAREIERIRTGAPSLKKLRSRRRRNNKTNMRRGQGDYLTDLTYQRERRLMDMEHEMMSMMQNLENLNIFFKTHGQTPYERLMADNPQPPSQFSEASDHSEQNSIFARHSPQMRPRGDKPHVPSLFNPYEDTYEFMHNRVGHYGGYDYDRNDYRRGWHNHHELHQQTSL